MPATQAINHTPGPWTVEPSDSGDSSVGLAPTPPVVFTTIPNREDRSIEIAVVGSTVYDNSEDGHNLSYGDADANGRLIAAAPDLLAALHRMLDCHQAAMDAAQSGASEVTHKPCKCGACHAARAAIAKAEA